MAARHDRSEDQPARNRRDAEERPGAETAGRATVPGNAAAIAAAQKPQMKNEPTTSLGKCQPSRISERPTPAA